MRYQIKLLFKDFSYWISPSVGEQISEQFDKMNFDKIEKDELKYFNLSLKDGSIVNIRIRNINYINVLHICKLSNKRLDFWKRNLENIELLKKNPLIEYEDGSFAHPDIAILIGKWCSSEFEEQLLKFFNTKIILKDENKVINYTLKLKDNTDFIIPIRDDGYVNATELCKAGGKRLDHYQTGKQGKEYLNELIKLPEIRGVKLLSTNEGKNGGTWVHRKVALHLAQWISPSFAVQVSNWLDELLLTGKVELGKEKTNEELENIYKQKIDKMQLSIKEFANENISLKKENNHLSKLHDNILKKRNYHKFKKGNCVYIVKDDWREKEYLKFGKTSNINDRLQDYRTIVPECKILFLVYLENNELLENNIKSKYNKILTHQNHEYVLNIEPEKFILTIKKLLKLLKFLNMESTIENNLELYNNPYDGELDKKYVYNEEDYDNIEIINEEKQVINVFIKKVNEEEDTLDKDYDKYLENDKNESFSCNICNKKYKQEMNLTKHLKSVHNIGEEIDENKDNKCYICNNDKCYSSKNKLKRHIDTIHNKKQEVMCDMCEKKFASKDSLNSHIKLVHEKSQVVNCLTCNKVFSCNASLEAHIKTVHNKSTYVECNLCDKKYTTKRGLDNHINKIHEGKIEKVECEICKKTLDQKNLKYHMFSKHKI